MTFLRNELDLIVEHTGTLWEGLRDQRLLVTGGTGFLGRWLLESFVEANRRYDLRAEAVVLTRRPDALVRAAPHLANCSALRIHVGDIRSFNFPDGMFTHVVHAAAQVDADPLTTWEVSVDGTRRALDFAVSCRAREFLFVSSGAVYGAQPSSLAAMPEEYLGSIDLTVESSAYAEGKRAAELLCHLYARQHGLRPRIARCFSFIGPFLSLDAHYAASSLVRDGLRGGPIVVRGDGLACRSYLYAADAARWLWTILLRGAPCRPYNVGGEREVTIAELAHIVARCFEPAPEVHFANEKTHAISGQRYVPSTAKARAELGLTELVTIDEATRRTVRWHSAPNREDRA